MCIYTNARRKVFTIRDLIREWLKFDQFRGVLRKRDSSGVKQLCWSLIKLSRMARFDVNQTVSKTSVCRESNWVERHSSSSSMPIGSVQFVVNQSESNGSGCHKSTWFERLSWSSIKLCRTDMFALNQIESNGSVFRLINWVVRLSLSSYKLSRVA